MSVEGSSTCGVYSRGPPAVPRCMRMSSVALDGQRPGGSRACGKSMRPWLPNPDSPACCWAATSPCLTRVAMAGQHLGPRGEPRADGHIRVYGRSTAVQPGAAACGAGGEAEQRRGRSERRADGTVLDLACLAPGSTLRPGPAGLSRISQPSAAAEGCPQRTTHSHVLQRGRTLPHSLFPSLAQAVCSTATPALQPSSRAPTPPPRTASMSAPAPLTSWDPHTAARPPAAGVESWSGSAPPRSAPTPPRAARSLGHQCLRAGRAGVRQAKRLPSLAGPWLKQAQTDWQAHLPTP